MYVLINRDEMDLVAKHPNFLALYNLGIINCPDSIEVIPLSLDMFNDYVDSELTMLYIAITSEIPPDEWSRQDLEYILVHLINECIENIIDVNEVCAQAEYCIRWDIEGYCSFVKGKREPSHDEGLWDNLTLDMGTESAAILITSKPEIIFKRPIQRPFE